ncbi:TonB C-terminal domain-containing protein [Alcaligenaceae bacterium CGII-47]|nr:TonB C-terminal domain-containing protein [Alcaligenaceae bacterium CGII-47]
MSALTARLLEVSYVRKGYLPAALVISLCLHAALLAWRFGTAPAPRHEASMLEVTLVNARSETPPLRPQILAQQSLDGGGTQKKAQAATPLPRTTDRPADEVILQALRRKQAELEEYQDALLAQLTAHDAVPAPRPSPELLGQNREPGQDARNQEALILNAQIATIKEHIERYNALPRYTYVGPSAQEADTARYVESWRKRIEIIGTEHYPPGARGKVYGTLQLTVYIRRDGSVDHLEFDRPSMHAVLNSAARRIIELAAPFEPFAPELAARTDILAITRTWNFTNDTLDVQSP